MQFPQLSILCLLTQIQTDQSRCDHWESKGYPKFPKFPYNVCVIDTLLKTKLYSPPTRPNLVPRPALIDRLNQGLRHGHKLTLISAPAGFGKTTLVSEWVSGCGQPVAWLSLDERDNVPTRFLTYLVAALRTLALREFEETGPKTGESLMAALQSTQPPPTESILTVLLNEIASFPDNFILVLDDYHLVDSQGADASTSVDGALTFLLQHLPPQMHLVIATREDPNLPLARLRVRGQLNELRVADLRFTTAEAAEFLNQVMGLNLAAEEISALEDRTEGWLAGLQLAALSMRGQKDAAGFIQSFTGSHHFVLDYLVEEVLQQQPEAVQTFLLKTAVLDRLTGSLCEAVSGQNNGQQTLEYLAQANLFITPLDNERRWYRYHHLFAELLRQRLQQSVASLGGNESVEELHCRASTWYEEQGLEIEAFQHAAAANDIERTARLVEGEGMPLLFKGAMVPVLNWLRSLPEAAFDGRPSLLVMYASALTFVGQAAGAEEKLQAAEAALQEEEANSKTRDLAGHIAAIRAMLAVPQGDAETIISQSRRALELLHPDNLPVRTNTTWTLGFAYQLQGDRAAASEAYSEGIAISRASGNIMVILACETCLGQVQESENQLTLAEESYRHVLQLVGNPPWPVACEAYLGLARIFYQWNDLDTAEELAQQSLQLARHIANVDTPASSSLLLAQLKLAQRDVAGADALLAEADRFVQQHNFAFRIPEVAAAQVLALLQQGKLAAAADLAQKHDLPLSQARVYLAQGDPAVTLSLLAPLRRQVEAKGLVDEQLKTMVLQAVAHDVHGEKEQALRLLGEALALAEPGGFIRLFIDEGPSMAHLLSAAAALGILPHYVRRLLAAFEVEGQQDEGEAYLFAVPSSQPLVEPLSQRELEVLQLVAEGLSNREISERLYLALNTVKGHNRNIFSKLNVKRRTEAIVRARELGLL